MKISNVKKIVLSEIKGHVTVTTHPRPNDEDVTLIECPGIDVVKLGRPELDANDGVFVVGNELILSRLTAAAREGIRVLVPLGCIVRIQACTDFEISNLSPSTIFIELYNEVDYLSYNANATKGQ